MATSPGTKRGSATAVQHTASGSANGAKDHVPDAFDIAREGLEAYGASVSERELVDILTQHGREEGKILESYSRFAKEAPSPAARYLVSMILEDERRHHRVLGEIANAIGWVWEEDSPMPSPPALSHRPERDEALIEETRALLAEEERDRKVLRKLRRKLGPYADTTLWALLVDLMIHDTEKHAKILRFILDHEG